MKTLKDLTTSGAKVLLRVDFDVPVADGVIQEPFRIEKQKETIGKLLAGGARALMIAHITSVDSFEPLLPELRKIIGREFSFLKKLEDIPTFLAGSESLALLENTRTWPGEKDNDPEFAKQLSTGFDAYVNNAFAVCHRAHASVDAVAKLLPSYAGLLIEEETSQLSQALSAPAEGKFVIMGGAKAETKVPVIRSLLPKAQAILVGGVIANDILKARGEDVQKSIVDENSAELLKGVDLRDPKLLVPDDFVATDNMFLDIGSQSVKAFESALEHAKMIIWNGPMGKFEDARYMNATRAIAEAVIDSGALSIIGGGDTISAVNSLGLLKRYSFVSTGGGAMLAFLTGDQLPGLAALGYDHS